MQSALFVAETLSQQGEDPVKLGTWTFMVVAPEQTVERVFRRQARDLEMTTMIQRRIILSIVSPVLADTTVYCLASEGRT